MGKDLGGPATQPEATDGAEDDETVVGTRPEGFERTGMRRTAASAPDSLEVSVDLSQTHSSELPTFDRLRQGGVDTPRSPHSNADDDIPVFASDPRMPSAPPRSTAHSAILRPGDQDDDDAYDDTPPSLDQTSAWRAPPRPDPRELIGKIVAGRYLLGKVLGAGGMGTVFLAEHTDLGKRVAIKVLAAVLDAHDEAKERFLREAKAASTIESDHIAQVFDIGEDFHLGLYMVMELLKGEDLAHTLAAEGPLPPDIAAGITAQVCLALERAHAAGVAHRDLKPANVFLTRGDDGSIKVKVLDFGIAKLLGDARKSRRRGITQRGMIVGTPQYMSPEQAQGLTTVDHRTDMYSVGALLFECLTGTAPYPELESNEQTLYKIVTEPPPRLASRAPGVAPELDALVTELMMRDPEARPGSAREVRMRLAEIFPRLGGRTLVYEGGAPAVAPVVVVPRTGSGITVDSENGLRAPVVRRAKPALLAAVAALAVTTAVVAFFVVKNRSGSGEPGQQTTLTAAQTAGDVRSAGAAPAPPSTGVRALVAAEEEAADLVRRAQHALETGDVQRARELASDAVRRAPASAEGWLTLGAAHEALGDGAAARAAYRACKEQAQGERARECGALLERP